MSNISTHYLDSLLLKLTHQTLVILSTNWYLWQPNKIIILTIKINYKL